MPWLICLILKFIGESDIRQVLKHLTKDELASDEQQKITEKIIEEGDIDNGGNLIKYLMKKSWQNLFLDGKLSFLEFETLIKRSPDFLSTFHIRI